MRREGSSLAKRALGRQLGSFRKRAEVSQNQAGGVLGVSAQTIGRLEEGVTARIASDLHLNTLCDRYRVGDADRRVILALAREVRFIAKCGGGWWRPDLDRDTHDFDPRVVLDHAAIRLTAWATLLLPPILRTSDYSRAVAWTRSPHMPTDQVEESIHAAAKQQRALDDSNLAVEIIISEAAIREEWGGPGVMAEQRRHLAEISHLPNVSLRVVPINGRSRIGALTGPFTLLEFPILPHTRLNEPPLVHITEYVGNLYLERSGEVDHYRTALAELRRTALSESASRTMLLETV
ncbi:helix-turn-helix domain-containing protein [Nocardia sp. NPDC003482]